jgi:hypothetical protein
MGLRRTDTIMNQNDHNNTMSNINKLNKLSKKAAVINKNICNGTGQSKESMDEDISSSSNDLSDSQGSSNHKISKTKKAKT